jgi:hypothetical protein
MTGLNKTLLSLNFTKTQFTNFTTKNNQIEININYNKSIPNIIYTVFLGLTADCSLTWLNHAD